jgi:hypothetical protein
MKTILERSVEEITEAQAKLSMLLKVQALIKKKIDRLFMFQGSVNITLEPMTLAEAFTYIKSLKLIKTAFFKGRGVKPFIKEYTQDNKEFTKTRLPYAMEVNVYSDRSEKVSIFGYINLACGTVVEINIPISDKMDKITQFKHNGSTSRSRITGMIVLSTPFPFNTHVNWSGIHKVEFYSI